MFIKKISFILLSLLLCFSLFGCDSTKDLGPEEFNDYLESLPQRLLTNDNLNLAFTFLHPENYGFKETLLNLPFDDQEDYKKMKEETLMILDELESFAYDRLDQSQQLTYAILKDNLERSLPTMDYYDLDASYLGSFISFQSQLPFLLAEYSFENEHDLNSYFHILETSEESFHKYVIMEQNRQEKGTGMSKAILDKTIQQCAKFANANPLFLVDTNNQKIAAVDFLNEEQKEAAKQKNEDLLVHHLQVAYHNTEEELSLMTPDDRDLGLAHIPDGKAYYEALLKQYTGTDMDVEEVQTYLKSKWNELRLEIAALQAKVPELSQMDISDIKYSDLGSVEEVLHELQTKIVQDFPKLTALNFKISTVDESMSDHFSLAAYLQSRIDSPLTAEETIIINGDYEDSLFTTLMHEGYPGHMYQTVYFKSLQLPTIRYLLDYGGYIEGWATYVESYSSTYATTGEQSILQLNNLYSDLSKIIMCQLDIGIHYEGWDRSLFKQQMEDIYGEGTLEDEAIQTQYDIFLETPANTLKYNLSYFKFQDLRKKAQKELGEDYDAVTFHEVILKTGPAPFKILEEQIDEYIETTLSSS